MSWINNKRVWDGFTVGAELESADASENNSKRVCTNRQSDNPESGSDTWQFDWDQLETIDIDDFVDLPRFTASAQALEDEVGGDDASGMVSSGDQASQIDQDLFGTKTHFLNNSSS